ncbi:hypothetical protein [Gelidibacter mesophilus]|uniref:hypothetical protein n=1 Tax=Gelidibacter mesophilus TaxID=169050 RepID=UPI0004809D63|nr:hypothetical protein [Gelidibacter mesophilus]
MAENNDNIILNLMQNVSDKLNEISNKIDNSNASQIDKDILVSQEDNIKSILSNQSILKKSLSFSKEKLKEVLEEIPTVINQNTEYVLFGKDTPFSSKFLLSIIFLVLLSYPIFKYIPQYLNEKSVLKEERDNYQLVYDYVFFHSASEKNGTAQHLENTLQQIRLKDTVILQKISDLKHKYETRLRRNSLEAELKKLEE